MNLAKRPCGCEIDMDNGKQVKECQDDRSRDYIAGWNAAIAAAVAQCDEVREDRRANPPAFPWPGGTKKFTGADIASFMRSAASSCKYRIEGLRKSEEGK